MWDRKILKSNAKTALRGRYWLAFAVALVASLLAGKLFAGGLNPWSWGQLGEAASSIEEQITPYDEPYYYDYYGDFGGYGGYMDPWGDPYGRGFNHGYNAPYGNSYGDGFGAYDGVVIGLLGTIGVLAFAFGTAFRVFVSNPVNMGKCRYFVHNRFGDSRFEHLFGAFRRGYPTAVGAMFTTDLLIDLWLYILIALMAVCLVAVIGGAYMMSLLMIVCLLLFIPYFIKLYQYTFVKYLLADNPQLKGTRARQLSTMLTSGEKGSLFVLDLSFLGWYFLGALCLGLGHLFVNPYYEATKAELYIFLRERAIQNGLLDPRELNLYPVPPVPPYGVPQQDTAYATYQKPAQGGQGTSYGAPSPMYPGAPVPPHAPTQGYPPYGTMPGSYPNPPQGQTPYGATPPQNPSALYPPYGAAPAQNPDASGPHAPYGVNAPGYPGAAPQAPAPWEHPSEPAAAHPADPGTRDIFQAPPHDVASAGAPEAGPKAPDLTKHPQPAPTGSASAGAGQVEDEANRKNDPASEDSGANQAPLRRPRFDRLFLGKGGSKDGRTDRFWMGKDRKRASGWKWKNFMERKKDALCGAGRS